ncbi:MAG: glycosyltransferase family 2 protein [Planctomycetota bacterium]|jgi:glycosyltransferase involved in cell wall biosynthesis
MSEAVAVVIPAFNSRRFLGEAIASVQAQTEPPAELIVVDDGSEDGCAELAEELDVRCIRRENGGPGAARNTGVAATSSPLIAFLDADDYFEPGKLARQAGHMAASDCVACGGDALILRAGKFEHPGPRKNGAGRVPARIDRELLMRGNPLICSSMMLRRTAFEAVGGFDEDRDLIATEDYDLWLRVLSEGSIDYLDEALAVYRRGPWSLSDNELFARGTDKIMAKVLAANSEDPELQKTARIRRGMVRIDLAYDRLLAGDGPGARQVLRQARELGAGGMAAWKIWLRSWLL